MSRIHEALKKAEQERSIGPVTDVTAVPPEPIPVAAELGTTQPRVEPEPISVATARADFLRFEDLRKHCTHPEWHMDPNVNVFFNPQLSAHGAEQIGRASCRERV